MKKKEDRMCFNRLFNLSWAWLPGMNRILLVICSSYPPSLALLFNPADSMSFPHLLVYVLLSIQ